MTERRCIVTTKRNIDIDAFIAEMNEQGRESVHVPERRVEISDINPDSRVNTEFLLTEEERTELLNDSRVIAAEWADVPLLAFTGAFITDINYNRTSTFDTNERNWTHASCSNVNNPFGTGTTLNNQTKNFTLTGEGVDVVVIDSGIQADHPEWLNADGTASRFQRIDWTSANFSPGNVANAANMYTDINGHGTACHSSLAGRRYGWASGANIYSMSVPSVSQNPGSTFGTGGLDAFTYPFQRLRMWHENKPVGANGYRRPTVVSTSWQLVISVGSIASFSPLPFPNGTYSLEGQWRGNSFNIPYNTNNASNLANIGIFSSGGNFSPFDDVLAVALYSAIDSEIQDCIDSGIIFFTAAGNDTYKISAPGDPDWDNRITSGGNNVFYHRGGTPMTGGSLAVGGISSTYDVTPGIDNKADFSRSGPGVIVYAPAEYLPLAISNSQIQGSAVPYPDDTNYNAIKISGTSFSSPATAGWVATIAEARPYLNQAMAQQLVEQTAISNRIETTGNNYASPYFLNGGNNRYLYNPFNSNTVSTVNSNGNISISGGTF